MPTYMQCTVHKHRSMGYIHVVYFYFYVSELPTAKLFYIQELPPLFQLAEQEDMKSQLIIVRLSDRHGTGKSLTSV